MKQMFFVTYWPLFPGYAKTFTTFFMFWKEEGWMEKGVCFFSGTNVQQYIMHTYSRMYLQNQISKKNG